MPVAGARAMPLFWQPFVSGTQARRRTLGEDQSRARERAARHSKKPVILSGAEAERWAQRSRRIPWNARQSFGILRLRPVPTFARDGTPLRMTALFFPMRRCPSRLINPRESKTETRTGSRARAWPARSRRRPRRADILYPKSSAIRRAVHPARRRQRARRSAGRRRRGSKLRRRIRDT